jgi:hypothetical protein
VLSGLVTAWRLAGQSLAVLGESDDGGRGTRAFRILDDLGLASFHDSNAAVGRAQIDTNDFGHMSCLFAPRKYFNPPRPLAARDLVTAPI